MICGVLYIIEQTKNTVMNNPNVILIAFRVVFSHFCSKLIHVGTTLIRNMPSNTNIIVVAIV
jgi:hypothetical protein